MLLLHKVTHSQFPQLANNSMIFKQLPTMISDLNKLGIALKSLDAMKIGTVGVDAANIEAYRTALKGLSVEQSVFALASKGATEEQIRQILVTNQATASEVEAAMAKAGLTTATKALTQAEMVEMATKNGVAKAEAEALLSKIGITATEEGQVVVKKQITLAMLEQAVASGTLTKAEASQIATMLGLTAAEGGAIVGTNLLTAAFAKLNRVINSNPWLFVIGAALTAIIASYEIAKKKAENAEEAIKSAHEEAEQALSDSRNELSNQKSELQSINSELEQTKDKIREISSIGSPTLTEQNELDKLSIANAQLEIQKSLLENNIKLKQRDAAIDAKKLLETQTTRKYVNILDNTSVVSNDETYDYAGHAKNQTSNLKNAYSIYMKALRDGNINRQKLAQELISESSSNIAELTSELIEITDSFKYDDGTIIDGYENLYNEYMGMIYNLQSLTNPDLFLDIAKTVTSGTNIDYEKVISEAYALAYEGNFDIDKLNQDFVKALADAGIDESTIGYIFSLKQQEYQSLIDKINDKYEWSYTHRFEQDEYGNSKYVEIDISEEQKQVNAIRSKLHKYAKENPIEFQLVASYDENFNLLDKYIEEEKKKAENNTEYVGNYITNAISRIYDEAKAKSKTFTEISFLDIFSLKDSNDKLTVLGRINEEIDKFQSAYKGLKEAMDSYNETGTFTLDQVQEIISYGGDYLKYLMDENGNLQLNEEALNKVAIARINEMRAKVLSNLMDNLDKITTEEQALNYLETQLLNTATAYDALTASRIKAWSEKALENGISQGTINKVTKSFENQVSAINEMFNNISLDSIYKSSSSSAKSAAKDAEQATKEYIDSYMNYMEQSLKTGRIDYQTYARDVAKFLKDMYDQGKIAAKDYHDYTKEMLEVQKNVYDKALSAITRRLEKESEYYQGLIDEINKKNDSLEKQKDDYDSILSVVEKVYDKEIDALQEQQKAIDEKIDALRDANDEEERGIALANARYALEKAQQQRTRLVYTEGEGFIYKQDNEAIGEARKELKDVELENTISQLEKEKEALDEDIENLEKYKDLWSEIPDLHQQAVNEKLAIDMFGADYEKVILQSREQAINEFANKYISIQQQVDDNNSLIESYEEKKEYYDKLREQWNDLTDVYEQSVEDQYAAMLYGVDWEDQILSGRIDYLNDFKDSYIEIQQAIVDAAWNSANEQVKAAKEAAKGADGNTNDITSLGFKKELDKNVEPNSKFNVTYGTTNPSEFEQKLNDVKKYGSLVVVESKKNNNNTNKLDEYYKKLKRGSKYASGTKNAKKGLNLVGEEGTETFVDNDGNVSLVTEPTLIPMKGGETVIKASETEKILTGIDNLVPLNWDEMWNKIKISPQAMPKFDLNIPDYSKMLSNAKSQDVSITQHIELTLPNVTNTSGAENVIETIRKLPLDALQYVNRR